MRRLSMFSISFMLCACSSDMPDDGAPKGRGVWIPGDTVAGGTASGPVASDATMSGGTTAIGTPSGGVFTGPIATGGTAAGGTTPGETASGGAATGGAANGTGGAATGGAANGTGGGGQLDCRGVHDGDACTSVSAGYVCDRTDSTNDPRICTCDGSVWTCARAAQSVRTPS